MSVATIKQRILDILELDSNIQYVKTQTLRDTARPRPTAVVFTGANQREKDSNDIVINRRDFRIVVLVRLVELGRELQAEQECEPFYDSIPALFDARPSLTTVDNSNPLAGVQTSFLTGDAGYIAIELARQEWSAIEFILQVEYFDDYGQGL